MSCKKSNVLSIALLASLLLFLSGASAQVPSDPKNSEPGKTIEPEPPKTTEPALSPEQVKIIEHLKFLGYEVSVQGPVIRARHKVELNLLIKVYEQGFMMKAVFAGSEHAKKNLVEFMALVNECNKLAKLNRYYIDEDGDLIIEALFPGYYEKSVFGNVLSLFNQDFRQATAKYPDISKFLK